MDAMKRSVLTTSAFLAGVLALAVAASAGQSTMPPAPATPAPATPVAAPPAAGATQLPAGATASPSGDKNAAVYTRVCSTCHDAQRILSNRRTKDQWGEVIDKMVERGAQGTDEDFNAVMDYLVGHYGRINVNRGSAKDLATVLKVTDQEAAAIVAYRTSNGPIPDFDTLAKVPGINVDTLTQNRDAISY
jgi:competence protein ComEA